MPPGLDFTSPDLGTVLDRATPQEMDGADFGIVRLDSAGVVGFYNLYESRLSGLNPEDVVGKNFFLEVAPCTNNFMVALRYEAPGNLDENVDYVFSFRMKPTRVQLRLIAQEHAAWRYLVVRRA